MRRHHQDPEREREGARLRGRKDAGVRELDLAQRGEGGGGQYLGRRIAVANFTHAYMTNEIIWTTTIGTSQK